MDWHSRGLCSSTTLMQRHYHTSHNNTTHNTTFLAVTTTHINATPSRANHSTTTSLSRRGCTHSTRSQSNRNFATQQTRHYHTCTTYLLHTQSCVLLAKHQKTTKQILNTCILYITTQGWIIFVIGAEARAIVATKTAGVLQGMPPQDGACFGLQRQRYSGTAPQPLPVRTAFPRG